ncbi:MAG: DUF2461 domain-containing protein [Chryseolinea sp.]
MDSEGILKFLRALAKNNNREWFEKNKERYLTAKDEFEKFIIELLPELIKFDDSLKGLEPRKLIFRIYRDVRFSKDKTPYKNNFGASFSASGKGMGTPGFYFQLQPGNESFVAAGLFMPDTECLAKIRQEIDYNGDRLEKIAKHPTFKKHFSKFWDENKLKTMPKGYPKDHPRMEWLKLKSFMVVHTFTDKQILDKKLIKNLAEVMRAAKPLNDFLKEANAN